MKILPRVNALSSQEEGILDDAALFKRLGEGDLAALGVLYDRYHADVAAVVARTGIDRADVEDSVHETFLKLIACANQYDGRLVAKPWILGIAWRVAGHRRRSLVRWLRARLGLLVSEPDSWSPESPESAVATAQQHAAFDRALATLPIKMRAVVVMVDLEGFSGEEAAHALGIPTATVWTRLHYARKRLRVLMDDEIGARE